MAESQGAPGEPRPFDEHPLYRAAMKQLAKGDETGAADKLRRLSKLYPRELALRDQLVRLDLRATLLAEAPAEGAQQRSSPFLRALVFVLFALTVAVVLLFAVAVAYDQFKPSGPVVDLQATQVIESLRQDAQQRMAAGDYPGARTAYQAVLTQVPGEPTAQAALEQIDRYEALDQQYVDALLAQQQEDWKTALELLRQISAESPGYRDVEQRIQDLEELEALETSWTEAQNLIAAGDWPGATSLLIEIRTRDPDFHRTEVEEQLYRAYTQMADLQIKEANGNLNFLQQAIFDLNQALRLRPTDRDLIEERRLATEFVAGFAAFDAQDWAAAVDHWEQIQSARPDYQGGVLEGYLRQAYPQAAGQLIAQANGSLPVLRRAIGYLDRALAFQPGDAQLANERQQAAEYVAGAEAFAQGKWDTAIAHWGPLYAVYPDYQGGVLEANLRLACASGSSSAMALCPP
jgi:tetratricopeptide (TPR) repeat protein